ncbi:MAG: hypothetical protein IJU10_03100 [Clostridia bacterium]|nr:hypothetical protein [Clostridia bacterium]
MKTVAHYKYNHSFSLDELFYTFWNKEELCNKKPKPEKAFEDIEFDSLKDTFERHFLVDVHFCGTFNYLLEPLNIPRGEKIDKDFVGYISLSFSRFDGERFTHCSLAGSDCRFFEIIENENKSTDYTIIEDIDVDQDEIIKLLGDNTLRLLLNVDQDKICKDGTSYEGNFTIKRIIAIDEPILSLTYTKRIASYSVHTMCCQLSLPFSKPGTPIIPQKGPYNNGYFKRKKFPKVLDAFEQYFMDQLSKIKSED